MKKKINIGKKGIAILVLVACIILFIIVKYIIGMRIGEYVFAEKMEEIAEKNENTIFSIDKIIFYSSANAIDNSEGKVLQDLDVSQFTDIAIYIYNTNYSSNLTGRNTVKELYINNINIDSKTDVGNKSLTYKNPANFGKFNLKNESGEQVENSASGDEITYSVVYTNEENTNSDYLTPVFYTDCSNPITLSYMNENVVSNYKVHEENSQITFDGKILKAVNIDLESLECNVSFDIHIKNNLDEEFVCTVGVDVPLKSASRSIYDGYIYAMQNNLQDTFTFFKI